MCLWRESSTLSILCCRSWPAQQHGGCWPPQLLFTGHVFRAEGDCLNFFMESSIIKPVKSMLSFTGQENQSSHRIKVSSGGHMVDTYVTWEWGCPACLHLHISLIVYSALVWISPPRTTVNTRLWMFFLKWITYKFSPSNTQ